MILPFMVVCEGTGAWKPLTETRNCSQASFVKKVSENIGEGNINVFVAFLRASWCFTCTDVQHRGFDKKSSVRAKHFLNPQAFRCQTDVVRFIL
jgi:hypothetical protein